MHGFVWAGVALFAVWAALWLVFKVVSGLVHVIVLVAVVLIVWGLFERGATALKRGL